MHHYSSRVLLLMKLMLYPAHLYQCSSNEYTALAVRLVLMPLSYYCQHCVGGICDDDTMAQQHCAAVVPVCQRAQRHIAATCRATGCQHAPGLAFASLATSC